MPCYRALRAVFASAVVAGLAACSTLQPEAQLEAFSTQLMGLNQVPPVATPATGRVVAVLNKDTLLLRWKLSFKGLGGPATGGGFCGPAGIGANASSAVAFKGLVRSPLEGQAILTPTQAADLMAGKWYVSIRTAAHPGGEIRGQMILRQ